MSQTLCSYFGQGSLAALSVPHFLFYLDKNLTLGKINVIIFLT